MNNKLQKTILLGVCTTLISSFVITGCSSTDITNAAPVGPKELGSNSKYVFALPARYNYEFLEGYEEVEAILESNPLKVIE